MTRRIREWALVALIGLTAGVGGYAYHAWRTAAAAPGGPAVLLAAQWPDLEGRAQPLAQWRGQVLVVNFWATWCAPCREEIPLFVRLQAAHGPQGLQFVGVAIDQAEPVRAFANEFGMNFPVLLGNLDAIEVARTLGNKAGVLPFTVVLARDGRVVHTHTGAVHEAELAPLLASLI